MSRALFPLLKPADDPERALFLSVPLPGTASHPQLPVVTFAESLPSGYGVLTRAAAGEVDPASLLGPALERLATVPRDLVVLPNGVAVHVGQDLAAELLLDETFLKQVGLKLGTSELWVSVPHRAAFYAMSSHGNDSGLSTLTAMVRAELRRRSKLDYVSDLAFRVCEGKVIEAVPYSQLAPNLPESTNWLAGFVGASVGGAIGMGLGVLASAWAPTMEDPIAFGLAGLLGSGGLVLGLRWR